MYKLLFLLTVYLFFSCTTSSQVDVRDLTLKESFEQGQDEVFLEQFPKDFNEFHRLFGWDQLNDSPGELYENYEVYIDHWFSLISTKVEANTEKQIIAICTDAQWEPKGIDYFQDRTISFIKTHNEYDLLNDLNDKDAFKVIFFLFHSPGSVYDEEFGANLTQEKKKMMRSLFLLTEEEELSSVLKQDPVELYSMDLDGDDQLDKIVAIQYDEIDDKYDRDHFGLTIELMKKEGDEFIQWKRNDALVFNVQNGCVSEGFMSIYVDGDTFTIVQQGCYDYSIVVNSSAKFICENGEVYLNEYKESYFDKKNHDLAIPAHIWSTADFGKLKFEDLTTDLFVRWRNVRD